MKNKQLKNIYFAGGCFWGVEEYFSRQNGVVQTDVGYANGNTKAPRYHEVCHDNTGHTEAVHIEYDPGETSLETLAKSFFRVIDPTSQNRQGNDIGTQYRTGIYYTDDADRKALEKVLNEEQQKYDKKIVTEIRPLENYYPAEEYHQKYLKKNPGGYCHIKF